MKQDKTIQEEQEQIVNRAKNFDALLSNPGWTEIENFFAIQIDNAITTAAEDNPLEAEKQRLHVIQWNAKREIFDSARKFIESTRAERDRILLMQKEEEQIRQYVNSNRDAY